MLKALKNDPGWILFTLLFGAFLLGGALILFITAFNWEQLIKLLESNEKDVEPISILLTFLLGLPVALAGSIAAIIIARRTLSVNERQEYLENVDRVEKRVNDLSNLYWDLAYSYRIFYKNTTGLVEFYLRNSSFKHRSHNDFTEKDKFKKMVEGLLESRQDFIDKILLFSKKGYSHYVLDREINSQEHLHLNNCLSEVKEDLKRSHSDGNDFSNVKNHDSLSSILYEMDSVFNLNADDLYLKTLYRFFNETLLEEEANYELSNILEELDTKQFIVLMGLFLFQTSFSVTDPELSKLTNISHYDYSDEYVVNSGFAFLIDLLKRLPNDEEFKALVQRVINERDCITTVDELTKIKCSGINPKLFWGQEMIDNVNDIDLVLTHSKGKLKDRLMECDYRSFS